MGFLVSNASKPLKYRGFCWTDKVSRFRPIDQETGRRVLPGLPERSFGHMNESDIVKAIMKYLKSVPQCFCWKEHGGMYGTAGIPDIMFIKDGHYFGFEVKRPVVGIRSKLQEQTARMIQAAGGTAAFVCWPEEAIREVEEYEKSQR